MRHCPNLRFHIDLNQNWDFNACAAIGHRVEELIFLSDPNPQIVWNEDHLSRECPNTETIWICYGYTSRTSWNYAFESKSFLENLIVQFRIYDANSFF